MARSISRIGWTCVVGLAICVQAVATTQAQNPDLQKKLEQVRSKHQVPSLSFAVMNSDEVIATMFSGVRKKGAASPVTASDRFPIASNTKSMTATLAGVVVESGKIKWENSIEDVWPGLSEKHLHPKLKDVTLDELLSHQSGLVGDLKTSSKEWLNFFEEKGSPKAQRQKMLQLILKKKPKFERGTFHYSNLGYVVAAAMLEKQTGGDFEDLMQQHLFEPLKMKSAFFRTMKTARKLKRPMLWGHDANDRPVNPKNIGAENPSVYTSVGTVNLTLEDYARYVQWHLRSEPGPVLKKQETVDHLHTAQAKRNTNDEYGAGWILLTLGPMGQAMSHTGSNTTCYAHCWILPDRDFAAIACTNTGKSAGLAACDEMIGELMKQFAR